MFKFEGEKVFQLRGLKRNNQWVELTTLEVVQLLKNQMEIFTPEKVITQNPKAEFNFDGI